MPNPPPRGADMEVDRAVLEFGFHRGEKSLDDLELNLRKTAAERSQHARQQRNMHRRRQPDRDGAGLYPLELLDFVLGALKLELNRRRAPQEVSSIGVITTPLTCRTSTTIQRACRRGQ